MNKLVKCKDIDEIAEGSLIEGEKCDSCGGEILPRDIMAGNYRENRVFVRVIGACNSCGDISVFKMAFVVPDKYYNPEVKKHSICPKELLVHE